MDLSKFHTSLSSNVLHTVGYSHFLILQINKDTYAQLNVYYSLHKFQIKEKLLLSLYSAFLLLKYVNRLCFEIEFWSPGPTLVSKVIKAVGCELLRDKALAYHLQSFRQEWAQ